ncbi:MAG TPA: Gfo/Idh/MocA family oxidoreductase [Verrucomicrobiota bacterium]|jgi:predicted dehydrogenase|nr:MAG: 1,5-anhydro-D-fructose reductase [Verrucomicrobia bacterium ADurb.Bin063]HNW07764.1 Gfo/Idh/MocA family oxidoreductase [Verrucomicrobiota bacterium]HNZ76768.1 Gfo/Idh/MocA family oxidoreductase [Verrucomicrobiota bacterium]HOC51713.1 Gfo/Idh/MocA family oxidoreductase [Verrucomicrobiota bacterium]HOH41121.1 Gfo/Idh/MocA family oxidoreductase [Verrucomicrobiota bacterium]
MRDKLNRRQFLQATATAALGAPLLLRAAPARKSPNDRITLGVIGTGTQGRALLNNFLAMPDTQVVAVCDVDTTRRDHHRRLVDEFYRIKGNTEYRGCPGYKDFRDVLARPDIDAVVIAVPDHWHAYIAIAACKAGKDVYCEKPLSLTIGEARAMVTAARKYDRVFQTGSMQRSSSEFRKACELVRNGRIGRVKQVIVDVGPPSMPCNLPAEPLEPGLNWDLWLGPAPERPYNSVLSPRGVHTHFPDWRNYREYSGGMMTDWGAHHFDIAQWGLGMDESGPVEIIPPADPQATRGARFRYANGVEMIHGDSGGVLFIGTEGKILVNRGKFEATPAALAEEPLGDRALRLYNSYSHTKDFLDCMRSRQRPICDVEIGCRSVTVCHLGNLAYWNHRRLRWDPAREQFIGDREANRWIHRPQRGPWKT